MAELVAGLDNRMEGAFMTKKVADQVAETLAVVGVERLIELARSNVLR
jgi:hypothetical protein